MKKRIKWSCIIFVVLGLFLLTTKEKSANLASASILDVPLENQNKGDALGNGCEITALSMLLRYYDYDTNKNELAEMLDYVPLFVDEDTYGDPHDGFVGDITGGFDAMGVAVEPIARVAEAVVGNDYLVQSEEQSFESLEAVVLEGKPVWVAVTVDFQVPTEEDFRIWDTQNGQVRVTPLCHAAVITGVDESFVYVNDPYGKKNRPVDKEDFQIIYEELGSQSLYLEAVA